ncbi:copper chaperone [Polynucleobacter sp. TUM22923]|jgi:copper chaperone|uniref:heavy-metal-associated domain-containing protein n=1 Tax=Polynucleobacter sp. TUM22923 TaxID=3022126 RepID=UPI0025723929|nr:heavy-metal-associated domain-containing protein [Polynucleobacter sp. TUM22923]BDX21756.1 copper chaperone [Polynucleobacter sp. TUM22923]
MIKLKASGMTCGGCVNAVTRAIQAQDPQAVVEVELATQLVSIQSVLTAQLLTQIITEAGFPVVQ